VRQLVSLHSKPRENVCVLLEPLMCKYGVTSAEQSEVLTGNQPGNDWVNAWHWTKYFTVFFSNRK